VIICEETNVPPNFVLFIFILLTLFSVSLLKTCTDCLKTNMAPVALFVVDSSNSGFILIQTYIVKIRMIDFLN